MVCPKLIKNTIPFDIEDKHSSLREKCSDHAARRYVKYGILLKIFTGSAKSMKATWFQTKSLGVMAKLG